MPGVAKRTGEQRLGRTENSDDGNAKESGEMHRASVVGKEQRAFAELGSKLLKRGLADAIQATRPKCGFNRGAALLIGGRAEENPLHWPLGCRREPCNSFLILWNGIKSN